MSAEQKVLSALIIALDSSQVDGAHHKAWAIDQMVRALTGCQDVVVTRESDEGGTYDLLELGESEQYKRLVKSFKEDYGVDWDVGVP